MSAATRLTESTAAQLAEIALEGIRREYPNSPAHMLTDAADRRSPRELHPAFYGCLDWHSAVHTHWQLVRLLRLYPDAAFAPQVRAALREQLTDANLAAEAAYFAEPGRAGFERPYGWTWLLKLADELHDRPDADARAWAAALDPLAELIAQRYREFLPRLTYPIRSGVHSNTAFGLIFALDYARARGDRALEAAIVGRSRDFFLHDAAAPAAWEPGGGDFLSPSLIEADLMHRVLPAAEFSPWLARFLPGLAGAEPPQIFTPAIVSDRSDGQIVHLDGLNLSRAWCCWGIAAALPAGDARRAALLANAERHAAAGLSGIGSGDFMGDHWLGSFALHMLECAAGN